MAHQLRLSILIEGLAGMAAAAALAVLAAGATPATAAVPPDADACQPNVTDDTLRPLPPSLAQRAIRLFTLRDVTPDQVTRSTVVRCLDGHMLACNAGANLPCGKASTVRLLPQGAAWCRQHPDADFIPAYISGHDSIFHWRCANGAPVAGAGTEPTDASGFIMQYWQPIQ